MSSSVEDPGGRRGDLAPAARAAGHPGGEGRPPLRPLQPPAPPDGPPSARGPSKRNLFALVGLVAGALVLAAVAGGVYLAYQFLLGHDDRATADYAPPNALIYAALNTDPTSRAWVRAAMLAQRAGVDEALARLPEDGLEQQGTDAGAWDALIRPAIGGEVGLAVWQPEDAGDASPAIAGILMFTDDAKARAAIDAVMDGAEPEAATYRGVSYQVRDGTAYGIVDRAIVVAGSAAAFEDVVDAHEDGALSAEARFRDAVDRAAGDPLVFAWLDGPAMGDLLDEAQSALGRLPAAPPDVPYIDLGVMTLTLTAEDDAVRLVTLTEGRPASFPTGTTGAAFASDIPESAVAYMAGTDLYATVWKPLLDGLGEMGMATPFGAAGSGGGLADTLGIDVERDLLRRMTGPYALAALVDRDGDAIMWQAHVISQVDRGEEVGQAVDTLARNLAASGAPVSQAPGGFRLGVAGTTGRVTVVDDVLHVWAGSGDVAGHGTLADDPDFSRAMGSLPADRAMTGYVALPRLVALAGPDASGELPALAGALGPLAYGSRADGQGTRTEIVLFIQAASQ